MNRSIMKFMLFLLGTLAACKTTPKEEETGTAVIPPQTPVTITLIAHDTLREFVTLNATSAFLQSSLIKSTSNGYLNGVFVAPGEYVANGKVMFRIQTKEAKSIGSIINNLDSTLRFSGLTSIRANQSGYINQLNHQAGDYVQDGEQLAVISTAGSFGFVLNVPYELSSLVTIGKKVQVELPDKRMLVGTVSLIMPAVDAVSQTQRILVKVNSSTPIPENLIVRINILKSEKINVTALPKAAILSDESQSNFWVMKLIDSVTAVKVPVAIGMQTSDRVEITSPVFTATDQILLTGNYGLADTARVKIMKSGE